MIANYARLLELNNYKKINESIIEEADANPDDALAKVKSGMNGGAYKNQWDQLVKEISDKVDNGTTSGTFMVKHDESIGGKDMVNVSWSVDSTGKVTLSAASQKLVTVSATIKKAADKIFRALAFNPANEDEQSVYSAFSEFIKSDADLVALRSYWASKKIPYSIGYNNQSSFEDAAKPYAQNAKGNPATTLDYWLSSLFNAEEIDRVNDKLTINGVKYKFKAK